MDCIFCKIVQGEIPAKKVYEDEHVLAFHDIQPAAPTHILFIPKKHIESMNAVTEPDFAYIAHIHQAAQHVARELNIDKIGYRLLNNCGPDAG